MPCYHPVTAYKTVDGRVVFSELARDDTVATIQLPCGRCVGCRLETSRQWAIRCMHEAQLYDRNCFLSLTYRDSCLPVGGSLVYSDFRLFIRRVRERFHPDPIRYFMAGEYGSHNQRPHYHALLFGFDFPDKVYLCKSPGGGDLFRSPVLEELWPHGYSSIGDVTYRSCAYVARYVVKKSGLQPVSSVSVETGEVVHRVPEFSRMSTKPGIGARWLERFSSDVYPTGKVVVNGVAQKPPRFYDKRISKMRPDDFAFIQARRDAEARARYEDNTDERLLVKEHVARAALRFKKREL